MIKIAVDAMGGDNAPDITVKGAMDAIKEFEDIEILLYGDENKIKPLLTNSERISIVHTDKFIDMGEHDPVASIRNNKDTSLVMAFQAGKNREVDAVVSAGPTQAIVVGAHLIVKKMKSMHRVALAPIIPSLDGNGKILLDCGANVELRPEHLLELALYAKALAAVVLNKSNPKIGLINIGVEEGKGRQVDCETYDLFKSCGKINFAGNIEPKEALTSDCDILVTDGFTGNIFMKTIEGTAKTMGIMLKEEIKKSLGGKIGYLFMKKNLKNYKKRLDPNEVGGAMICGVPVPIVKAHGSSDAYAFKNAIRQVRKLVKGDVIAKIEKSLGEDNE